MKIPKFYLENCSADQISVAIEYKKIHKHWDKDIVPFCTVCLKEFQDIWNRILKLNIKNIKI